MTRDDKSYSLYFKNVLPHYKVLERFYNAKFMKKARFQLSEASRREYDLGVNAILKMAGMHTGCKADGKLLFNVGDCEMGETGGKIGQYSSFQRYFVKTVRQLGYRVLLEDEYMTSRKFPIKGYQTQRCGQNAIRIKHCPENGKYLKLIQVFILTAI